MDELRKHTVGFKFDEGSLASANFRTAYNLLDTPYFSMEDLIGT
jgi:hypothetical protein